jgi:hypothetical protein
MPATRQRASTILHYPTPLKRSTPGKREPARQQRTPPVQAGQVWEERRRHHDLPHPHAAYRDSPSLGKRGASIRPAPRCCQKSNLNAAWRACLPARPRLLLCCDACGEYEKAPAFGPGLRFQRFREETLAYSFPSPAQGASANRSAIGRHLTLTRSDMCEYRLGLAETTFLR